MKVLKAIGTFVLTIAAALAALQFVPVKGEQTQVVHAPRTIETDNDVKKASYGFFVDGKKLEQKGYYMEGDAKFDLNMSKFGHVNLVPVSRSDSGRDQLKFILVDEQQNIVDELPEYIGEAYGKYDRIIALYFRDVNEDDLDDVIVIAQYMVDDAKGWSVGLPVTGVYFQTEDGFTTVASLDEELNENGITNNVAEVIGYLKRKQIGK